MIDARTDAILRKHLLPDETQLHYVFAEEHRWHWTNFFGFRRFRLLACTDHRVLVTELSSMGMSEKATRAFNRDELHIKIEGLCWKDNGISLGEGRLVTLAAGDGTRYELRVASEWAGLEGQKANFGPVMALLGA